CRPRSSQIDSRPETRCGNSPMITARRRKRLRKRFGANSIAAKRLSSTVFYLDESIYSRRLADAMRESGATVRTPYDDGLTAAPRPFPPYSRQPPPPTPTNPHVPTGADPPCPSTATADTSAPAP